MKYFSMIEPNLYFKQEDLAKLLIIPHKKEINNKITLHNFKIPENKNSPSLSRNCIIRITENLTDSEKEKEETTLYKFKAFKGEKGLYIEGSHGEQIVDLIKETYKYDKNVWQELFQEYSNKCLDSKEVFTLENCLYEQTNAIFNFLEDENIKIKKIELNLNELANLNDDEADDLIQNIPFKKNKKIKEYHYFTPYLFENFYILTNSSSGKTYVCKKEENKTSWYEISSYEENNYCDVINEFLYDSHQLAQEHINNINDSKLIVEFTENKITKATAKIETLNLIQNYIFKELLQNKKFKYQFPNLSFEELLKNYVLQNEYYGIEERAIIPLLTKLTTNKNQNISYIDFSLINNSNNKKTIKHETITQTRIDEVNKELDNLTKLKDLPVEFQKQINTYLNKLIKRDNTDLTYEFAQKIKSKFYFEPQNSITKNNKTKPIKI